MKKFLRFIALLLLACVLICDFGFWECEAASAEQYVTPIVWTEISQTMPEDELSQMLASILQNANKYALNEWYKNQNHFDQVAEEYLNFGGTDEGHIRPPSNVAASLAIALKTGIYSAELTGISNSEATEIAVKLVRSLAKLHLSNYKNGWGNAWQSAMWGANIGFAGWLLWDDLTSTDRLQLVNMIETEADRFIYYSVPYYKNKEGETRYPGDSKGEENSWNAQLLSLATAMMPEHPNYGAWMEKNIELMLSSYARPSDVMESEVIHGYPLSAWLNGSNIDEDGTMMNHSIIHPDYMCCITQNIFAAYCYSLAQVPTPKAALFNADRVYEALSDLDFSQAPYNCTGGTTIYIDNSSEVFYPQGNDWGTSRIMQFVFTDSTADAFGFDTLASQDGEYWGLLHAQKAVAMQERFSDGHSYLDSSEDSYAGREEWVGAAASMGYFARWIVANNLYSLSNMPVAQKGNLALEAKVSSTSNSSAFPVQNINDGDYSTVHLSLDYPQFPIYITLNWESAQNFDTLVLYSDYANNQAPTNFAVEVSVDGKEQWETVYEASDLVWHSMDSTVEKQEFHFEPQYNKKGMRLRINSALLTWRHFQIDEIEVFDNNQGNIAPLANVIASSESDMWKAQNTNDGVLTTVYQSADHPSFPQSLTYIWETPQSFDTIELYSDYAKSQGPTDYLIEVSEDGVSNWIQVAESGTITWSYNDSSIEKHEALFPMQESIKGMRIIILNANLVWNHYQIDEVKVFRKNFIDTTTLEELILVAKDAALKTHIYTEESLLTLNVAIDSALNTLQNTYTGEEIKSEIVNLQAAMNALAVMKENLALSAAVAVTSESDIWKVENINDGRYDYVHQSAEYPAFPQYLTYT